MHSTCSSVVTAVTVVVRDDGEETSRHVVVNGRGMGIDGVLALAAERLAHGLT